MAVGSRTVICHKIEVVGGLCEELCWSGGCWRYIFGCCHGGVAIQVGWAPSIIAVEAKHTVRAAMTRAERGEEIRSAILTAESVGYWRAAVFWSKRGRGTTKCAQSRSSISGSGLHVAGQERREGVKWADPAFAWRVRHGCTTGDKRLQFRISHLGNETCRSEGAHERLCVLVIWSGDATNHGLLVILDRAHSTNWQTLGPVHGAAGPGSLGEDGIVSR